jgi:hypothetical protein
MDVTLADADLTPALRDALDRAAGADTVRVLSVQGGYRLVVQGRDLVGDHRPRGPVRLGSMARLGRGLPDLD